MDITNIIISLLGLIFILYAIKSAVAGINIGRSERKQGLQNPQPYTMMMRLNLYEPIITVSILVVSVFTARLSDFRLFIDIPILNVIPLPILPLVSLVILLICMPLIGIFSRNRVTRRFSHRLLWIGVWRVLWVILSIKSYGIATIIGLVVLARSISRVRELALDNTISVGQEKPTSPYQAITMGPEGLMVSSAAGGQRDSGYTGGQRPGAAACP